MHWRRPDVQSSLPPSSAATTTASPSLGISSPSLSSSCQQPKRQLTRAKKIHYLQDNDIRELDWDPIRSPPPSSETNSSDETGEGYCDRQRSSVNPNTTKNNVSRPSPVAMPQPLPLPGLGSEMKSRPSAVAGDVFPLPSTNEEGSSRREKERGKEREDDGLEEVLGRFGISGISNDFLISRLPSHVPPNINTIIKPEQRPNFKIHVPIRSPSAGKHCRPILSHTR